MEQYKILPDRGSDGMVVTLAGKTFYWVHWSASAPSAVAKGQPIQFIPVIYGGKLRYEMQTVAAMATITPYQGVAMEALTEAGSIWVQTEGDCDEALVTATADQDAAGKSLELIANGTTFIYDAAAFNAKTLALTRESNIAADARTYVKITLIGQGIVSGS